MKKESPSQQKNVCSMNKEDADAVISARWKSRKKIMAVLCGYALIYDLVAYYLFAVLEVNQDFSLPFIVIGVIQTITVIKLAFDYCGDVLTPAEREHYNSLA